MPMATKPGKVATCDEELPSMKSYDPLITVFQGYMTNWIHYVSITTMTLATKRGRVVAYI